MKNKILARLKQEYTPLGLGENFLLGLAESLANSGFVTDENIEGVVTSQKAYLESMQKSIDTRVQQAVDTAKSNVKNEQATRIADLEKQLEEAKKQQTKTDVDDKTIPEWYKLKEAERERKEQEYLDKIKKLEQANTAAEQEKAAAAAAAKNAERTRSIEEKAKAKGLPDWIIKRGFGSLPADADDATIEAYLSEFANDLKTNLLPGKGSIPQGLDQKADKAETDAMVSKLFPSSKKKED